MRAVFLAAWLCAVAVSAAPVQAEPVSGKRGLSRIDADAPATIEGELTYPGEALPEDLRICAVNLATRAQVCTSKQIRLKRKGRRTEGYRLALPAGDYQVYAVTHQTGTELRGYFTEFVPCGTQVGCPSHAIIPVSLAPGDKRTDVDPGDWYADTWPDAVKPSAETSASQPQAAISQTTSPARPAEGKRSYELIGEANQSCEEVTPLLARLRGSLAVTPERTSAKVGELTTLSWSVGEGASRSPTYLVIAADGPIRTKGEGFYVLTPEAIAPFRLQQARDRTRVVVPLHLKETARRGRLDIRPLRAGPLQVSAAIVGFASCGELADASPKAIELAVSAGTPQIVIADKFETVKSDESILSPAGDRRIDIIGPRWRLVDLASGSQLSERIGAAPRFSPTGRFIVAAAEEQFTLFDAVDGNAIRQIGGTDDDIAWDDRDSFLVIGRMFVGQITVDYPLHEQGQGIGVGDGCRAACHGVESSAVRIDLENNLVLGRGMEGGDRQAATYAVSLSGPSAFPRDNRREAEKAANDRPTSRHDSMNALLSDFKSTGYEFPKRWDFIDGLKFTFIRSRIDGANLQSGKFDAALRRFLVAPVMATSRSATPVAAADPIAVATRGIARIGLPPAVAISKQEQRMREFGLELNSGIALKTVAAGGFLKRTGKAELSVFSEDKNLTVDQDLFGGSCGTAEARAGGKISIGLAEPVIERLETPGYTLTLIGGRCDGGNMGGLTSRRYLYDSRRPGQIADIVADIPEDEGMATSCQLRIGACGLSGMLFYERYLVIWSKESFAAAIYDLKERKLLHSLIKLPSPEVMQRMSLSQDLRTLTKIDSDGGFQLFDLGRSQKTPDGKYSERSVLAPVLLSGRVVEDEVVVWAPNGQFDATQEGASFVSMKLPGRQGDYTLQQYSGLLRRPGLLQDALARRDMPPPVIDRFPPSITARPQASLGRVKAEIAIPDGEVVALRVYQDGQFTDEIAVAAGVKSLAVDVPRLAGARWIALVAKGASGLYSQAATFDAGPAEAGRRRLHVISVGVDRYDDPGISQLELAASDAKRFHTAIEATAGTGVEIVSKALLLDREASRETILARLRLAIGAAGPGDTIALFVAGHGIQGPDNQYYLATSQTRLNDIAGTALRWSDLAAELAKARSRIAVFLDSCHSGSAGTGFFATSDSTASALIDKVPSGIVIFSAAKGRELSEEMPSRGGGVFTDALVRAMSSKATDLNGNGAIEASEFYAGVKGSVIRATDGRQTPWFARNDMVGDFVPF